MTYYLYNTAERAVTYLVCILHVMFSLTDMECADVPLLTPSSKEMMSQALKATFSGFSKEQQRLGIPKGTFCPWARGCGQAFPGTFIFPPAV